MKMYYVKMIDKRDDTQISSRNFKNNEEKAQKYFNLLKQDALMHKNDYYDIDEEIKYSDIKYELLKDEEVIEYFTIR
jgi:hypothetical protein